MWLKKLMRGIDWDEVYVWAIIIGFIVLWLLSGFVH